MGDVCLEFSKHFPFSLRHSVEGWCPGASFFLDSWAEQQTSYRHGHMRWWSGSIDHFHSSVEISDVGYFIKNKTDLFVKWKYSTVWCKFLQAALGLCCIMAESTVSRPHRGRDHCDTWSQNTGKGSKDPSLEPPLNGLIAPQHYHVSVSTWTLAGTSHIWTVTVSKDTKHYVLDENFAELTELRRQWRSKL